MRHWVLVASLLASCGEGDERDVSPTLTPDDEETTDTPAIEDGLALAISPTYLEVASHGQDTFQMTVSFLGEFSAPSIGLDVSGLPPIGTWHPMTLNGAGTSVLTIEPNGMDPSTWTVQV